MKDYLEYGVSGLGHKAIIDRYIDARADGAMVLNLGCGPSLNDELPNLASTLSRRERAKRGMLIAADRNPKVVEDLKRAHTGWLAFAHRITAILRLEATHVGIEDSSIDLILALGLFGGLLVESAEQRILETQKIFREAFRVLKDGGLFMVGNSLLRQPINLFIGLAESTGFELIEQSESQKTASPEKGEYDDPRYLLVLRKV